MENHNFSKKYVSKNGIISYEEIKLDNNIKRYQYLPYLNYINENLVDEYNKFILKRRFGYYQDENLNVNLEQKIDNIQNTYIELINLKIQIINNFNNLKNKIDNSKIEIYDTYKLICETNLNYEIERLNNILSRFYDSRTISIKKNFNLRKLFLIMFSLYFIFLLFYIKFN